MRPVATLEEALRIAGESELMVIGGGEIYALTLPVASRLYMTYVDTVVDGAEAFFPAFDPAQWREINRIAHAADGKHAHAFEFVDYRRANSATSG